MNSANLSQDCWETYVQNETSYEIVWECDEVPTEPVVYNIDRADVEAMQQITAGIQVYLTALIAYDLSGTKNAHLKFRNRDVSSSVIFQTLIQNKDFGKLRDPRFLNNIKKIGTDYASAVNWALKIDKELCPAGRRERNSRPGKVFSEGLCLFQKPTAEEVSWGAPTLATQKTKLMDTLKIIETVASGNPLKAFYGKDKEYSTEILWSALIDNPIKDIRSIGINFNRCNQISSVKDESVNGLMPNNDANFVLKFQDSCN